MVSVRMLVMTRVLLDLYDDTVYWVCRGATQRTQGESAEQPSLVVESLGAAVWICALFGGSCCMRLRS
jgi:hypothetical protein